MELYLFNYLDFGSSEHVLHIVFETYYIFVETQTLQIGRNIKIFR